MDAADNPALPVTYAEVAAASGRLAGHAHRTPVMTSRTVDERTGARVHFKCENFQRMGAFKFRGAFNALAQLSVEARRRGVLAYSSGNHAQAVALAGRELGARVTIVMPQDAPKVKVEATRGYGAEVVLYDKHTTSREELSASIAAERGLAVIPPFDHPHVVAGQGTAAKELIEDAGALDYLFVPCGGGGLISGCALAAAALSPGCRVIGIEPAAGDDATRSFRSKTLQSCHNPDTIADGARTHSLGAVTFPLVLALVHDMSTVSDPELIAAMRYLWERMKIVVEPTGALGAAGLFERGFPVAGKRVGVVVSGGNVDIAALAPLLRA
ncbi:MAG: pyridoxal-5'-phosphate-dependent protein [Betaproteobacteria bacterium RIFCSPLOWO2_02_FULL_65_20]|nr:MAG: pyridoxal-5'-phosphate-dependent protein [Betaproteobacteria bacterium RIFCSPLOWO2_02_FULL_65_20]